MSATTRRGDPSALEQMPATIRNEDFLSGQSGHVAGIRASTSAIVADLLADARAALVARPRRLARAAADWPRRRVLALALERPGPNILADARRELQRSHHELCFVSAPVGERGKFENLNALLAANPAAGHDWLLVVDDDVALPGHFLDVFVFLAERFGLRLAQPAHRRRSHAAWPITRRRPGAVVRETGFVEIGPVTAFAAPTFETLLPFPELRVGWGLDLHWSALAREHGWPIGVVDAAAITHGLRPVGAGYESRDAIDEARRFLVGHRFTRAADAARTLVEHRSW
jgi:hypothetical protein